LKRVGYSLVLCLLLTFLAGSTAMAKGDKGVIPSGVYADTVSLGGMNAAQATEAVYNYIADIKEKEITIVISADQSVTVTAADLGFSFTNPELISEAVGYGVTGNVIRRYKALKELEQNNVILAVEYSFDRAKIQTLLEAQSELFNQSPVEARLSREDGEFVIIPSENGIKLNVEASLETVTKALMQDWDFEDLEIAAETEIFSPLHSTEELAQVTDVIGTATTSFSGSAAGRVANVSNGCSKINGVTLYPGEELSAHDLMAPYDTKNGYDLAGAYISGRVVDVVGGGVCQVSTTLYNAVLQAELEVTERHNHSMTVSYVPVSADAAMAESANKDFRFVNSTDYPIYIEGYTTTNKKITFNIYGKETRDENRKVRYESEVLEVIPPAADVIYADASQPVGYIYAEGSHTGYKGKLWKIVTINGKDEPKELVNTSSYKQSPRMATVGVATDNPDAYNAIMAAINSGSIDTVKATIASLSGQ